MAGRGVACRPRRRIAAQIPAASPPACAAHGHRDRPGRGRRRAAILQTAWRKCAGPSPDCRRQRVHAAQRPRVRPDPGGRLRRQRWRRHARHAPVLLQLPGAPRWRRRARGQPPAPYARRSAKHGAARDRLRRARRGTAALREREHDRDRGERAAHRAHVRRVGTRGAAATHRERPQSRADGRAHEGGARGRGGGGAAVSGARECGQDRSAARRSDPVGPGGEHCLRVGE